VIVGLIVGLLIGPRRRRHGAWPRLPRSWRHDRDDQGPL